MISVDMFFHLSVTTSVSSGAILYFSTYHTVTVSTSCQMLEAVQLKYDAMFPLYVVIRQYARNWTNVFGPSHY